ncbi:MULTISPECIES: methyltransferase [Lysinibacillus]|uniref:methyltransferase n=1 Tax=Lysinibacillus TaxID=400634 RepID=UPI00056A0B49|nr:methyltransferase [Lysinibacillus sphaericus]
MDIQGNMIRSTIQGFSTSYLLYTACELGIFDALYQERRHVSLLAEELAIDEDILFRFMRPLVALKYVKEEKNYFNLLPLGERLAGQAKDSLKDFLLFTGRQAMPYWSKLCEAIKMNKIPYQLVEKQPYFQAQIQQNEKFEVFHNMMSKTSEQLQLDTYFAAKKDWHCIKTIIDIGGGSGEIIVKFLEYYRNAQGVVIDLQHVQQKAEEKLALYGFDSRCTFQAGDFFHAVPRSGDLYILSRILHDWEDEAAITILRNIAESMSENSALTIIEKILPEVIEGNASHLYMTDLNIWTMCGGKERTQSQFEALFHQSDLKIKALYPLKEDDYLIEVVKKDFEYQEGII